MQLIAPSPPERRAEEIPPHLRGIRRRARGVWVPAGFDGLYERLIRNTHEPDNEQSCWVWKGKRCAHYPRLNLRIDGRHQGIGAHRAMLVIMECMSRGDPSLFWDLYVAYGVAGFECDHECENPICVRPDHLQWLSVEEHIAQTNERRAQRRALTNANNIVHLPLR